MLWCGHLGCFPWRSELQAGSPQHNLPLLTQTSFADGHATLGLLTRRFGACMNLGQVEFLPLRRLGEPGVLAVCFGWVGDLCSSASHFWAGGGLYYFTSLSSV